MREKWKHVKGTHKMYDVSTMGHFRTSKYHTSHKYRPVKSWVNSRGYLLVHFFSTKYGYNLYPSAHKVVAEAFIPNPEKKPCINHKNGNKLDNRVSNLEWCTQKENMKHAREVLKGDFKIVPGEDHLCAKLTNKDVRYIYKSKKRNCDIAEKFGITRSTVSDIRHGKSWKHLYDRYHKQE